MYRDSGGDEMPKRGSQGVFVRLVGHLTTADPLRVASHISEKGINWQRRAYELQDSCQISALLLRKDTGEFGEEGMF
jgi:hypothetical protein